MSSFDYPVVDLTGYELGSDIFTVNGTSYQALYYQGINRFSRRDQPFSYRKILKNIVWWTYQATYPLPLDPLMYEHTRDLASPQEALEQVVDEFSLDYSGQARCFVCQTLLTYATYELGHIRAFCKGGDDRTYNFRILCHACNWTMGDQNLFAYLYRLKTEGYPILPSRQREMEAYFALYPFEKYDLNGYHMDIGVFDLDGQIRSIFSYC